MGKIVFWLYQLGDLATLIYLLVSDAPDFTWWNWLIIVPIDIFLASIWPVYWLILVPIFGG